MSGILQLYLCAFECHFIFSSHNCAGELFGALRGRLCDSNKNLVIATLSTVGGVASAMGPAVEKSSKVQFDQNLNFVVSVFFLVIDYSIMFFIAGDSVGHIEMSW